MYLAAIADSQQQAPTIAQASAIVNILFLDLSLFDWTLESLVGSFPPILSCNRALVTCNTHKLSWWLLSLSWQLDPPCYTVSRQSPLCSSSNNKLHCIASSAWAPAAATVDSTCFTESLALDLTHWPAVCFLISAVAVQWSKTPAMHYPTKDAEATTQEDKVETVQKLFTWRDQKRKGTRELLVIWNAFLPTFFFFNKCGLFWMPSLDMFGFL